MCLKFLKRKKYPLIPPPYGTELITVYGTAWCGDTQRSRKVLEAHNIPYRWVDIDTDKIAERYVFGVNHGNRSVPTIVFQDGSVLVEPKKAQLINKLAQISPAPSAL